MWAARKVLGRWKEMKNVFVMLDSLNKLFGFIANDDELFSHAHEYCIVRMLIYYFLKMDCGILHYDWTGIGKVDHKTLFSLNGTQVNDDNHMKKAAIKTILLFIWPVIFWSIELKLACSAEIKFRSIETLAPLPPLFFVRVCLHILAPCLL